MCRHSQYTGSIDVNADLMQVQTRKGPLAETRCLLPPWGETHIQCIHLLLFLIISIFQNKQ